MQFLTYADLSASFAPPFSRRDVLIAAVPLIACYFSPHRSASYRNFRRQAVMPLPILREAVIFLARYRRQHTATPESRFRWHHISLDTLFVLFSEKNI